MRQATELRSADDRDLGGADLVQRLLARSSAARARAEARADTTRVRRAVEPLVEADEDEDEAGGPDEVERLRAELRLVKAALHAEREEMATLRDQLEQVAAMRAPMEDVRLDRDRWANLVERLLFTDRALVERNLAGR